MKNTNILYGVIGLLFGIIVTSCFFSFNNHRWDKYGESGKYTSKGMMHKMQDGSMMYNVGMDMDDMMSGMMAGLQGKTGDAFDKEFLAEMIVHHQGAVEMAKAVLASSKRPELIKLANDIISAQTKEIGMMQGWQKQWFK